MTTSTDSYNPEPSKIYVKPWANHYRLRIIEPRSWYQFEGRYNSQTEAIIAATELARLIKAEFGGVLNS